MTLCTHTHTHTARGVLDAVSPGVGTRHLEGPKNQDRLNLGIRVFVYVFKVHMCIYMLGGRMRSWADCRGAEWTSGHIPDRGIGPSGAQMLNNLQLTQPSLPIHSPLRDSLIHLTLSGCQSINKSAVDILLRLSHTHLPKLQGVNMVGLRLELCQQAAKSFLRENLGILDSLGTMDAFALGPGGFRGEDLSANHIEKWLEKGSDDDWQKIYHAMNVHNDPPVGLRVLYHSNNPSRAVPFHHSANMFNMAQTGMFLQEDSTLRVPKWSCTLSGELLAPELEMEDDDEADIPQIAAPWSDNETRIMHLLFPHTDSLCLTFGRTAVF